MGWTEECRRGENLILLILLKLHPLDYVIVLKELHVVHVYTSKSMCSIRVLIIRLEIFRSKNKCWFKLLKQPNNNSIKMTRIFLVINETFCRFHFCIIIFCDFMFRFFFHLTKPYKFSLRLYTTVKIVPF